MAPTLFLPAGLARAAVPDQCRSLIRAKMWVAAVEREPEVYLGKTTKFFEISEIH